MTRHDPVIIALAPNGARRTTADHPAVPVTARALADTAAACMKEGASLLHLHIRNEAQRHLLDADVYRDTTKAVREQVGEALIVQTTTEAVGIYQVEEQEAVMRALVPQAASFGLREFIRDEKDGKELERARAFFYWVREAGIHAQYILYSLEDIQFFARMLESGVLPAGRQSVLVVCGKKPGKDYGATEAQAEEVEEYAAALAQSLAGVDFNWFMCAFGPAEHDCALRAAALGGHVRLGFENNLRLPDGNIAPDNAALVRAFVAACPETIAMPVEAKELLGIR